MSSNFQRSPILPSPDLPAASGSQSPEELLSILIERYESALANEPATNVQDYFPDVSSPLYVSAVCELLRIRIEHSWLSGQRDGLQQLLDELPEIASRPEILGPVAYEDFRQSKLHGVHYSPDWYRRQWPLDTTHWMDEWDSTLSGSRLSGETQMPSEQPLTVSRLGKSRPNGVMRVDTQSVRLDATADAAYPDQPTSVRAPEFPAPGTQFGQFEILRELGRGTFSRVYLAQQLDLAGRQVVLKVTAMPLGESRRLAKLQHANIMPLYSIHQVNSWYALCMPWLGSATFKDVIDELQRRPATDSIEQLTSSIIDKALDRAPGAPDSFRHSWHQKNYVDAVLMIAQQTACGLQHAHQRGILHRDIKPANILISFEGEPLLLDFNLSREAGLALSQHSHNGPSAMQARPAELRAVGGTLPYMSPEHLRAMWLGTGAVGVSADIYSLGVVLFELLTGRLPFDLAPTSLEQLSAALEQRQKLTFNWAALNPAVTPAVAAIVQRCLAAEPSNRYQSAAELAEDLQLHLANRPLKFAGNPSRRELISKFSKRHPSLRRTSTIVAVAAAMIVLLAMGLWQFKRLADRHQASADWEQFQKLSHQAEAALLFPEGGSFERGLHLADRALDVWGNWTDDTRVPEKIKALPTGTQPLALQQVQFLRQLVEEVQLLQPGSADDRREIDPAARVAARELTGSSRDSLVVASQLFLQRNYTNAIRELESALETQPDRFALWFMLAKCHFEQRSYRQADYGFAMAFHLDPQSALSLLGRALCDYWMKQDDSAWNHLIRAADLDPTNPAIAVNKALLLERQQRWSEALSEIEHALELSPQTPRYVMIRSRLKRRQGDVTGAQQDLLLVQKLLPRDPEDWIIRGLAVVNDNPEAALADFRQAAQWPSQSITARQNMAHVLSERLQRPAEALLVLTELLEENPDFSLGRAGRAVLLSRQKQAVEALADIELLTSGEMTPQVHYQVGCALALLAVDDQKHADRALHHLSLALSPAYGGSIIGSDRDLQALEPLDSFQAIKRAMNEIQQWQQQKPVREPGP